MFIPFSLFAQSVFELDFEEIYQRLREGGRINYSTYEVVNTFTINTPKEYNIEYSLNLWTLYGVAILTQNLGEKTNIVVYKSRNSNIYAEEWDLFTAWRLSYIGGCGLTKPDVQYNIE
jgi:hypothetical protein